MILGSMHSNNEKQLQEAVQNETFLGRREQDKDVTQVKIMLVAARSLS